MGYRRTHRSDHNQKQIVAALRKIGARVYIIDRPVDLLVEYRERWIVLEVKQENGRLSKGQKDFFAMTQAPAAVVKSAEQAIEYVTGVKNGRRKSAR